MPHINVVLKNGVLVPIPNAEIAVWDQERDYPGGHLSDRLICKQGEKVLAKFNASEVIGWVWRDSHIS